MTVQAEITISPSFFTCVYEWESLRGNNCYPVELRLFPDTTSIFSGISYGARAASMAPNFHASISRDSFPDDLHVTAICPHLHDIRFKQLENDTPGIRSCGSA